MASLEECLQRVDWSALEDGYGSSADLPEVLLKLASAEPEERESAFMEVTDRLVHQGTHFEASSHAVPFLLLLARREAETPEILRLLSFIAVGQDDEYLSGTYNPYLASRHAAQLRQQSGGVVGPDAHLRGAIEPFSGANIHQIDLACYRAVMEGVPIFADLLKSEDARTRMWAAYIMGFFPERREEILQSLTDILEAESDAHVAATAAISSGLVALPGDDRLSILLERRLRGRYSIERWGAAIAIEWWFHRDDPLVKAVIQDCLESADGLVYDIPFYDGNMHAMAILANSAYRRRQWAVAY